MFLYLLRLNKFKIKTILFAREKIQPCFIGPCASLVPHLPYHCIIQQQVLCSKRLNTKEIMDVAFKISNSIRAKALQRRLFTQEFEGKQFILHTDIRWLSSGKFFQRFRDLLEEIRVFLQNICDNDAKLNDLDWLTDLAFLADITGRLTALNL